MSDAKPSFAHRVVHLFVVVTALAASCVAAACRSTPATPVKTVSNDTWATVDGREITRQDVDKAYQRMRDVSQTVSEEESLAAKLSLLDDLIVQNILLEKAASLKLAVAESEIDTAYTDASKNLSAEALQQELSRRGLTPADMREGLRRQLIAQKLMEQEVVSKIEITDREITDFFNANRAQYNVAEESYRVAQIVVTPVREPQAANGTGDDATTPEAAAAKVRMLMDRLKAGASFRELAMGYSEDPESAQRGGDMGLIPVSRLRQAPAALRDAVLKKEPGTASVVSSGGAHSIVMVVAHEPAGQRDLSTPGVKDGITQTLRGRKEQLLRAAYLTAVRSDAAVINYLARRLVESKGAMPGTQPAAPSGK
jgi:peptidyl-prolyl cis-trans isomerase SurA